MPETPTMIRRSQPEGWDANGAPVPRAVSPEDEAFAREYLAQLDRATTASLALEIERQERQRAEVQRDTLNEDLAHERRARVQAELQASEALTNGLAARAEAERLRAEVARLERQRDELARREVEDQAAIRHWMDRAEAAEKKLRDAALMSAAISGALMPDVDEVWLTGAELDSARLVRCDGMPDAGMRLTKTEHTLGEEIRRLADLQARGEEAAR